MTIDLKKYEGLVKYAAGRYAFQGDVLLSKEDLEQEGWLVFVKIAKKTFESAKDFDAYFKTSLWNRMKECVAYRYKTNKRTCIRTNEQGEREKRPIAAVMELTPQQEYALSKAKTETLAKETLRRRFVTCCREALKQNRVERKIFDMLLEPSEELMELAKKEFEMKERLHSQGKSVYGLDTIRILQRHVAEVLGITGKGFDARISKMKSVLKEFLTCNSYLLEIAGGRVNTLGDLVFLLNGEKGRVKDENKCV